MTAMRTASTRIGASLLLGLSAASAHAQWQPLWSTPWQHPEPIHSASPLKVRSAADGATFAGVDVTHHSASHVALVRFNPDGSFAWTRERPAQSLSGLLLLDAGRVAIVGDGGTAAAPLYINVYDATSGNLLWERQAAGGRTLTDERDDTEQVAVDSSGNILLLASDGGDYVIVRYDSAGNPLPTWRRTIDADEDVRASGILALPDGGVIVTGEGASLHGGYVTLRLDAQGSELFRDVDPGGIANPLGPAYLGIDADGNALLAAAPESPGGVPCAQVWKLSPTGARLWTRVLPNPGSLTSSMSIGGFTLAPNGDVLIVADMNSQPFRLVRLDGATGAVRQDVATPLPSNPSSMALAPNGRVLVGGYAFIDSSGHVGGRLVEFAASGAACRVANNVDMFSKVENSASANGWTVLGSTQFIPGTGNDAFVRRYDADGACSVVDVLFANGFQPGL
ncbi:MAG: hypothetical protein ABI411_02755 [Tahibacter sp.]